MSTIARASEVVSGKPCFYCGEQIPKAAKVCKHCGHMAPFWSALRFGVLTLLPVGSVAVNVFQGFVNDALKNEVQAVDAAAERNAQRMLETVRQAVPTAVARDIERKLVPAADVPTLEARVKRQPLDIEAREQLHLARAAVRVPPQR